MSRLVDVFVENEAGSAVKNLFDQVRLKPIGTQPVARPYPFPYGFVLDTLSGDGDCLDCFVLTIHPISTGQIVICEVMGLMEQWENGDEDSNILASPVGERHPLTPEVVNRLSAFVLHVFENIAGREVRVGGFHPAEDAVRLVERCRLRQR